MIVALLSITWKHFWRSFKYLRSLVEVPTDQERFTSALCRLHYLLVTFIYHMQETVCGGKFLCFEWKILFTVKVSLWQFCRLILLIDKPKVCGQVKNRNSFPHGRFPIYSMLYIFVCMELCVYCSWPQSWDQEIGILLYVVGTIGCILMHIT